LFHGKDVLLNANNIFARYADVVVFCNAAQGTIIYLCYNNLMRITGGSFRGRTLNTSGFQGIRPTTDRARETIFNIVSNHCNLEGITVLDVCAGTGALGFESISRGAVSAVFVEKSRKNCTLIGEAAQALGVSDAVRIRCDDAVHAVQHLHDDDNDNDEKYTQFDLVFCDPPYAAKLINAVFSALAVSQIFAEECIFVAEHDVREVVLLPQGWTKLTMRSFGETAVDFFQCTTLYNAS
jgi:16S rRNA (guanine966-N2)-methyltransferase